MLKSLPYFLCFSAKFFVSNFQLFMNFFLKQIFIQQQIDNILQSLKKFNVHVYLIAIPTYIFKFLLKFNMHTENVHIEIQRAKRIFKKHGSSPALFLPPMSLSFSPSQVILFSKQYLSRKITHAVRSLRLCKEGDIPFSKYLSI